MYDSFAMVLKKDCAIGKIMKIKAFKKCKEGILINDASAFEYHNFCIKEVVKNVLKFLKRKGLPSSFIGREELVCINFPKFFTSFCAISAKKTPIYLFLAHNAIIFSIIPISIHEIAYK